MTIEDQVLLELTAWRENRHGGREGMQSVMNVIQNRARRSTESIFELCTDPEQFTSISGNGDPELTLWPNPKECSALDLAAFEVAQELAAEAMCGTLADITGGADLYYAPASIRKGQTFTLPDGTAIPFPIRWNPHVVTYCCTVKDQVFFK